MKPDLTAWALWGAGVLIPIATQAAGLSFIFRDIDGGPYFFIPPLWFIVWQPLVLIGWLSRNSNILVVGLVADMLIGGGILLGNLIQVLPAMIAPSNAIAETPLLEILAMHVAAMLTGGACVALVAYFASRKDASALD